MTHRKTLQIAFLKHALKLFCDVVALTCCYLKMLLWLFTQKGFPSLQIIILCNKILFVGNVVCGSHSSGCLSPEFSWYQDQPAKYVLVVVYFYCPRKGNLHVAV